MNGATQVADHSPQTTFAVRQAHQNRSGWIVDLTPFVLSLSKDERGVPVMLREQTLVVRQAHHEREREPQPSTGSPRTGA
jgi:hypothetical protein